MSGPLKGLIVATILFASWSVGYMCGLSKGNALTTKPIQAVIQLKPGKFLDEVVACMDGPIKLVDRNEEEILSFGVGGGFYDPTCAQNQILRDKTKGKCTQVRETVFICTTK